MAGIPLNPDLPLSWRRPGTYIAINLNNPGSGPAYRLLMLGEHDAAAQKPGGALYRANNEQDVINSSGPTSVLRMMYNDALAQVGGGVIETWIGNVDQASGGTAAVYTFQVQLTGSNPTGSGYINWALCGRLATVGFTSADTATTIAANLAAAAGVAFAGLPVASVTAATGTITLTLSIKAAWGEDFPSTFYVSPGLGVAMGVTMLFATNATGAGSAKITVGRDTYSFALAGGETPTQIAAGLLALLVGDIPLAATASTGTLTITFNNDWPIRHVVGLIATSTGTTIAVNGGTPVAAGTSSPNGTIGLGSPTTSLTTMLGNIDNQALAFGEWVTPWFDSTTLGTINSQIETEGGGLQCRNQRLNACSAQSLATAGALPAATTPTLTSTTRGAVLGWLAFEAGNAAFEYAVRFAAAKAANTMPQKNFNGLQLKSTPTCPLIGPPPSGRSPGTDINSAIQTYFMAPIVWDDNLGRPRVEHSRTTSNSADRALHKWSLYAQLDAQRAYIAQKFNLTFTQPDGTGVSFMPVGVPFTQGIVTIQDYDDLLYQCCIEMERLGFYYGADLNKAGNQALPSPSDPGRINATYIATALIDVDIASIVANRAIPGN